MGSPLCLVASRQFGQSLVFDGLLVGRERSDASVVHPVQPRQDVSRDKAENQQHHKPDRDNDDDRGGGVLHRFNRSEVR